MTSLRRVSTLLTLGSSLALSLTGCPGSSDTPDAFAASDAFSTDDALSADDAFSATDAFSSDDAFSAVDAFSAGDAGASDAPLPTQGSYVSDTCGPADGPALQITISEFLDPAACTADPLHASTSFYIHDLAGGTLPPSAGTTITSTAAASNGSASQCPGGSPPCRVSEDWSITFTSYAVDGGAAGQYTITWGDGSTSVGSFDATRCEHGPILCG